MKLIYFGVRALTKTCEILAVKQDCFIAFSGRSLYRYTSKYLILAAKSTQIIWDIIRSSPYENSARTLTTELHWQRQESGMRDDWNFSCLCGKTQAQ